MVTMKIKKATKAAAEKPATDKVVKPAAARKSAKTREKGVRVTFSVRAETGSEVWLAGSFNNWDPTDKKMADKAGDGFYTATLTLPKGTYEYKFVINGTWCADPECAEWVQNDMGTLNSVRHIQ